jgi:hypothetical protein
MKLPNAHAKLARAAEHRESIAPEIATWSASEPLTLTKAENRGRMNEPIRCSYTVTAIESPPERWALVAGDAIQNARAALDHAIWAMVVKRRGDAFALANRNALGFPIHDKSTAFSDTKLASWGFDARVIDAIRDAQPFARQTHPRTDPLWFLRELSNVDKHRMLHVIVVIGEDALVHTQPALPGFAITFDTSGPLDKGAVALSFTAPRPAGIQSVAVKVEYRAGICFAATPETGAAPIDVTLREIQLRASEIIDSLEKASVPKRRSQTKPVAQKRASG